MIVNIVVDAVTPGIAPAVALKEFFKHSRRIEGLIEPNCPAIDHQGPAWMVGDDAVIFEPIGVRFSRTDQLD
jgi:hypothetical protein